MSLFKPFSSSGNIVWEKEIGQDTIHSFFKEVMATSDGNYLAGGEVYYPNPPYMQYPQLYKFDEDGNMIWEKYFYHWKGIVEELMPIEGSTDIMAMLTGYGLNPLTLPDTTWCARAAVRLDENGNERVYLCYIPTYFSDVMGVTQLENGEFVAGSIFDDNFSVFSPDLQTLYQDSIKGTIPYLSYTDFDTTLRYWYPTPAHNICATGGNEYVSIDAGMLFKSNTEGDLIWGKSLRDDGIYRNIYDIGCASDGGVILTGSTSNSSILPSEWSNPILIKTDCEGNIEWDTRSCVIPQEPEREIVVMPNPTSGHLLVQLPQLTIAGEVGLYLYDITGKLVHHTNFYQTSILATTLPALAKSIYMLKITHNGEPYGVEKVAVE